MSDWYVYVFGVLVCICGWYAIPRLIKYEENKELQVVLKALCPIAKLGGIFMCITSLL